MEVFFFLFQMTYSVKLKVKSNGELVNSQCECPAGAGPHSTCKHTAALAIMLQTFVESGILRTQKSCTELLQTFHRPKKNYSGKHIFVKCMRYNYSQILLYTVTLYLMYYDQILFYPTIGEGSPMKVEDIPVKRKCQLIDPRPEKFRKLEGYNDYVRNLTTNYIR